MHARILSFALAALLSCLGCSDDSTTDPDSCDPSADRGACCYDDGVCVVRPPELCAESGGVYQGSATCCIPNPCEQPLACCFADGRCEIRLQEPCTSAGGANLGSGPTCEPNPCPQRGACCFEDGHCTAVVIETCSNEGGVFQGEGTVCNPNPCPPNPGACCFADGHCELIAEYLCHSRGGIFGERTEPCDPNPCPQFPGACCASDGTCEVLPEYLCVDVGHFEGRSTKCDPNPCPQLGGCCFPDGRCELLFHDACDDASGVFLGELEPCDPNPCNAFGACCVDCECHELIEFVCADRYGFFHGVETTCAPDPCGAPEGRLAHGGRSTSSVRIAPMLRLALPNARNGDGTPNSSLGPGEGTVIDDGRGGCGTLVMNADGTYEKAYAWRYGGIVAPDFGAFAECYVGVTRICSFVVDLTTTGTQTGQSMEIFVYSDRSGAPGAVRYMKCVTPGPVATWPRFSRHTFPVDDARTGSDAWWVGYFGDWEGSVQGWYIGADIDGFGGCPMTKIAPGLGFPSGWQNVSVVWEPTLAIGIGAEVNPVATKRADTTWSKIERLTR